METEVDLEASARPGRTPRYTADQRRQLVIDAAEDVFIHKGYYAAKMNDIATCAGMSKKTLYQLFPTKAALFEALLDDRLSIFSIPLGDGDGDPERVLVDFLVRTLEFLLSPKQIALTRLLITESHLSPEIAEALEKQRMARDTHALEIWMAKQGESGCLKIGNSRDATKILMGLALGKLHFDVLLNLIPKPDPVEIQVYVEKAVKIFLAGLRAVT